MLRKIIKSLSLVVIVSLLAALPCVAEKNPATAAKQAQLDIDLATSKINELENKKHRANEVDALDSKAADKLRAEIAEQRTKLQDAQKRLSDAQAALAKE